MRIESLKILLKKMQYQVRTFASYLFVVFLLVAFSQTGFAKSKVDGDWEGALENGKLPLVFHIRLGSGCSVDSPSQAIYGMPILVTLTGKTVRISTMTNIASFEGIVDGSRIVGTYSQTGSKWPLTLKKASKKHDKS